MSEAQQAAYDALGAPFRRCFGQVQATNRNFQLAKFGVEQLSQMNVADLPMSLYPKIYSVYSGLQADSQLPANYSKERLMVEIKEEMGKDFPLLSASAARSLWTALEDLVREFSAFWITAYPGKVALHKPESKLGIPMGNLLNLDTGREKIAEALCQSIMGEKGPKAAVCRYDHLQKTMGLTSPATPKPMRTALIELEAIRHIIVHRSSVVDEQFKLRCPSPDDVPEAVGTVFRVNSSRIERYRSAVYGYVSLMMQRVVQAVPEVVNF